MSPKSFLILALTCCAAFFNVEVSAQCWKVGDTCIGTCLAGSQCDRGCTTCVPRTSVNAPYVANSSSITREVAILPEEAHMTETELVDNVKQIIHGSQGFCIAVPFYCEDTTCPSRHCVDNCKRCMNSYVDQPEPKHTVLREPVFFHTFQMTESATDLISNCKPKDCRLCQLDCMKRGDLTPAQRADCVSRWCPTQYSCGSGCQ